MVWSISRRKLESFPVFDSVSLIGSIILLVLLYLELWRFTQDGIGIRRYKLDIAKLRLIIIRKSSKLWGMTERGTLGLNELEPSKPFDRAGCIRHALSGFTPLPSLVPLGETRIGSRYFHSYSKYTMPGEQVIGHYDLDLAVAEKVRQFGSLEGEPTDAELQRLNEDETQTRKAFGSAIVTHARQFGLVKTLTPEQVKEQMLDHNLYKALDRIVNHHISGFSYHEW